MVPPKLRAGTGIQQEHAVAWRCPPAEWDTSHTDASRDPASPEFQTAPGPRLCDFDVMPALIWMECAERHYFRGPPP